MTAERRVLAEVGVGADAEHVYRILLANPGLSTSELSNHTEFSPTRLRSILAELERLAMITRLSGTPARFQPAPPDVVVETLISSREEALQRTRLDARELLTLRRLPPEQVKVSEIVEILTSREGLYQQWTQMQTSTQQRLEVFVRPPFTQQPTPNDEDLQAELMQRGVVTRGIYDQRALAHPGILEHMWRMVQGGEQARVVSELPMKLVLSDRRLALVPLAQENPEHTVDAALMVRRSALLDALIALFDTYWERGLDVHPGVVPDPSHDGRASHDEASDDEASDDEASDDQVVALMSSGFKDEAIARQLGVSTQTVRRRISAVRRRLGVTTRFQAGRVLGRQDRLDPDEPG